MDRGHVWLSAFGLLLAVLSTSDCRAAIISSGVSETGKFAQIAVSGEITRADVAKFKDLVSKLRPNFQIIDVELDSPGGDVFAALEIGKIIRSQLLWTAVPDSDGTRCASACVFILASGVVRIAGSDSRVVIHRPYILQQEFAKLDPMTARQRYAQLSHSVRAYLATMGMSGSLFEDMLRVPSDEGRQLSFDEMREYGLTGWDPAYQEWSKARNKR